MATNSVKSGRLSALERRIEALEPVRSPADAELEALAAGLLDAALDGDGETLRGTLAALRDARSRFEGHEAERAAGWVAALAAFAHWAIEKMPDLDPSVGPGTQAGGFLAALAGDRSLGSSDLRQLLETDETQVSRTGRRLLEAGLVGRYKAGRSVLWELTPRGRRVLESLGPAAPVRKRPPPPPEADPPPPGHAAEYWRDLLRRAWRNPLADDPSEPHEFGGTPGSPRERILAAALKLHDEKGVLATSWDDLAEEAGVPPATVSREFPTLDHLVPACGSVVYRQLQVPPPEHAEEVFAGVPEEDRAGRLVDELFSLYDRADPAFKVISREADRFVPLRRSGEVIDESLTALATAALPDADPARVRALTDVSVWRSFRDQGVPSDEASALLTRTLEEIGSP